MRRPHSIVKLILLSATGVLLIAYAVVSSLAPVWVYDSLQRIPGQPLTIGKLRVAFPATLVLSDVRLVDQQPGTLINASEIAISPLWLSWERRTLWLRKLRVRGLTLQARRTAQGTMLQPVPDMLVPSVQPAEGAADTGVVMSAKWTPWRMVIQTLEIQDSAIEFVDQKNTRPFQGSATRIFLVGGPVSMPFEGQPLTFAVQGVLKGASDHAAPWYCSGWVNVQQRRVDVSCQLEPLRMAAFEPYYQKPLPQKLYDARLSARGRLVMKHNEVSGRIQFEIDNFSEADLESLGKAGDSIRKLAGEGQRTLSGELQLAGALDKWSEWRWQLVPGNELVQQLMSPVVGRGIEFIKVRIGSVVVPVGLVPATDATKADSEAAKQEVQDALSVIAPGAPGAPPVAVTMPVPTAPDTPADGLPVAPPPAPAPAPAAPPVDSIPPAS